MATFIGLGSVCPTYRPVSRSASVNSRKLLDLISCCIGMVEVTLDNGVTGVGAGYMAVFAPKVFEAIVNLTSPYLLKKDAFDIDSQVSDLSRSVCDCRSLEGTARHVTSAYEIVLVDAKAKSLGVPACKLFADAFAESIQIYGSAGCCSNKEQFETELERLESLDLEFYKIRAKQIFCKSKRDPHSD